MTRRRAGLASVFGAVAVMAVAPMRAAAPAVFVTPAWLADHLRTDRVALFHLGDKAEYDAAHLPGARYLTLAEISDPAPSALNLQMASIERLQALFEANGVSDQTTIVLYFGKDRPQSVMRVYVALDYLGLADRTFVLDGGMPAWRAAGHETTTDVSKPTPGHLTPHPHKDVIVDAAWVLAHLNDAKVKVIDARTPDFFEGSEANSRFPRPGHIPGASNVPYSSVLSDAPALLAKSVADLKAMFEKAGAKPGTEVVTYCHIGQQASQAYVAAKLAGYTVHLYDGSFEEWSAMPDKPVVKGAGGR